MITYRGSILAKGSKALELFQLWQKDMSNKDARKKLDQHMKEAEKNYEELLKRY